MEGGLKGLVYVALRLKLRRPRRHGGADQDLDVDEGRLVYLLNDIVHFVGDSIDNLQLAVGGARGGGRKGGGVVTALRMFDMLCKIDRADICDEIINHAAILCGQECRC